MGCCLHDYVGYWSALKDWERTSLDMIFWFCFEIFVRGLFRYQIGYLADYLVIELLHVEKL